ncbi:MAG: hypothetical protein IJ525_03035 [Alphaproteobacteria bacterium]|nr:hypothetical protein [Alphaproteobacteria bacterium]
MHKLFLIITLVLLSSTAQAEDNALINQLEKQFTSCSDTFEQREKVCPESWSFKCYNHLMSTHHEVQACYKKVAVELFHKFYNLSETEASQKFDNYVKFIYEQYLFIFAETDYCNKENCGVSVYLYSEYATSQQIFYYVNKIIGSISARN